MRKHASLFSITYWLLAAAPVACQETEWQDHVRTGSLLRFQGRFEEAEQAFQTALREAELTANESQLLTSLNNLAVLFRQRGRYREAQLLLERGLLLARKSRNPEDRNAVFLLHNLALVQMDQATYSDAERSFGQALMVAEKALNLDDPEKMAVVEGLASLAYYQKQYSKAEKLYRQVLTVRESSLGPMSPAVAITLSNLSQLYIAVQRFDDAEALARRALTIRQNVLGHSHPGLATSWNTLGALCMKRGRWEESERYYREALAILDEPGEAKPETAMVLNNLAELYSIQKRYSHAEPLYLRALEINRRVLGDMHPRVGTTLVNYAALLRKTKRRGEAAKLEQSALAIRAGRVGQSRDVVDFQALRAPGRK